jgi:hypothetical protein
MVLALLIVVILVDFEPTREGIREESNVCCKKDDAEWEDVQHDDWSQLLEVLLNAVLILQLLVSGLLKFAQFSVVYEEVGLHVAKSRACPMPKVVHPHLSLVNTTLPILLLDSLKLLVADVTIATPMQQLHQHN